MSSIRIPYNSGLPKNINGLSIEEKKKEAYFFSEGCTELEDCLNSLWKMGIDTFACCKGFHKLTDEDINEFNLYAIATCVNVPYISFNSTDVLKYLSSEFINNDNVEIELEEPNEHHPQAHVTLRFYGSESYQLITRLKSDVENGIKNSSEQKRALGEKINRKPSPEIMYNSFLIGYEKSNITLGKMPFMGCPSFNEWMKSTALLNALTSCTTPEIFYDTITRLFELSNISEDTKNVLYKTPMFIEYMEKNGLEIEKIGRKK